MAPAVKFAMNGKAVSSDDISGSDKRLLISA